MKKILKDTIRNQEITVGFCLQTINPDVTESIALSGVDYIVLDMEHTGKGIDSVYPCIITAAAHNVPVIVRTADKEQWMIEQALDSGAQGVLVPTVETAEECEKIVSAAKYAPMGTRGYCPMSATFRWMNHVDPDVKKYAEDANRDTFVAALIETPEGLRNLPEMVKVEGIDAFLLGPADYGMRLGRDLWDERTAAEMNEATEFIIDSGKICIATSLPQNFEAQYRSGARVFMYGLNVDMILQRTLSDMRKTFEDTVEKVNSSK